MKKVCPAKKSKQYRCRNRGKNVTEMPRVDITELRKWWYDFKKKKCDIYAHFKITEHQLRRLAKRHEWEPRQAFTQMDMITPAEIAQRTAEVKAKKIAEGEPYDGPRMGRILEHEYHTNMPHLRFYDW